MKSKQKIALLGGDLRQYSAALQLSRGTWDVQIWGMNRTEGKEDNVEFCRSWEEAISDAVGIVLPLPATTDGIYLHCPFYTSEDRLRLYDLLDHMGARTVIVGGKIPETFRNVAESRGVHVRDYFESEEFQIENAYTTAEAAVSIAMNHLNQNLCDSQVAVTGFGRIAKHLVRLLRALNVDVTVLARKESDLCWARSYGCHAVRLKDAAAILCLAHGYDVIYNTVPHWLFDRTFLEQADPCTFLIDLASVPGGVDVCAAKELGSNVLWATSLPGKYAPDSAGELIATCVDRILGEEGEA
jgi:dipicolinate synthase subunit A